ncbi:MAG: host attachment protein [Leptospirales bacterium]
MSLTWILVSGKSSAMIYQTKGPGGSLDLLKSLSHPKSRMRNSELTTDGQGRNKNPAGSGSGPKLEGATSPQDAEATLFTKEVARELSGGRKQQKYDRLVLVASPEFLGKLRETLDSNVLEMVVGEINKDYLKLPLAELHEKVNEAIHL